MATPTELFINSELPKRPYTNQFPLTLGHIPVATGIGLEVVARALSTSDISGMNSYATQEDLSNVLAGLWDDRGAYTVNAAGNIDYPSSAGSGVAGALMKGDIFTVAGAVAGVSTINNIAVNNGDTVRALVDDPSATDNAHWSIAENNIGYIPENTANKTTNTDLSGATGTYPDTPTVKSYIDKYDISAASINSTGTVTLTRTASDLTFQVPTAVSGLSFDANTGVLTSSYTNGATSTTITVAANEVSDNVFRIKDNDYSTKKIAFEASGIATGQTRTITMPDSNVNLGNVAQAASTSTTGYLTSTDWNTFNNKNNKNVRIIRVSTQNYTVTTADADGNTSIYMEYTGVGNPTITIPASLTNPITIFNFSYPKNLNITWSGSHGVGGMGATSPFVIFGFDGIRAYPYKNNGILQYYQVEWVNRTRYSSNMFIIHDIDDYTKNVRFNVSGVTAGQFRDIIMPDSNVNLGNVAQAASTSTTGYLTSADWNTFNNKLSLSDLRYNFISYTNSTPYTIPASAVTEGGITIIELSSSLLTNIYVANTTSAAKSIGDSVHVSVTGPITAPVTLGGSGATLEGDPIFSFQHQTKTLIYKGSNVWKIIG